MCQTSQSSWWPEPLSSINGVVAYLIFIYIFLAVVVYICRKRQKFSNNIILCFHIFPLKFKMWRKKKKSTKSSTSFPLVFHDYRKFFVISKHFRAMIIFQKLRYLYLKLRIWEETKRCTETVDWNKWKKKIYYQREWFKDFLITFIPPQE